jgi:hypothetical protein
MIRSLQRRLARLEKLVAGHVRTHYVFQRLNETFEHLQARIRAMRASGEISRDDRIVTLFWLPPGQRTDN